MRNDKNKHRADEKELEALRDVANSPRSTESLAALRLALQSPRAVVISRTAHLIKEQRLEGFHKELLSAFSRFLEDPIARDPGCLAKLAALEALDFTELEDTAPFLVAIRHVQEEKAWGPRVDTATSLRARGVLALARLNYIHLPLVAAELLVDPEAPVRQAAVEALVMAGDKNQAALLLLKLGAGDKEPLVTLSCMGGLLSLSSDWALPVLKKLLYGKDEVLREMSALALGESRREDALVLLSEHLESLVLPRERAVIWRALGLHRSEQALQALLKVIEEGSAPDAVAAVEALAARRFEPGMIEKVTGAAQRNPKVKLGKVIEQTFQTQ